MNLRVHVSLSVRFDLNFHVFLATDLGIHGFTGTRGTRPNAAPVIGKVSDMVKMSQEGLIVAVFLASVRTS